MKVAGATGSRIAAKPGEVIALPELPPREKRNLRGEKFVLIKEWMSRPGRLRCLLSEGSRFAPLWMIFGKQGFAVRFLGIQRAWLVIKLAEASSGDRTLLEQAKAMLAVNAFLILDAEGVVFTSFQIGEIMNVVRDFQEQWGRDPHAVGVINLSPMARRVFETAKVDQVLPVFSNLSEAMQSISTVNTG